MKKFKGYSFDTKGCEFHYTCLVDANGCKVYFCNEFPELESETLKGLKVVVGNK